MSIHVYILFYQSPHQHQYLFNHLKHSGHYMYHLLQHSKTLCFCQHSDCCTKQCYAADVFMQVCYVLCAPWTESFYVA